MTGGNRRLMFRHECGAWLNRKVSKNRYFMGFRRWFDSGLLTGILTLPMFGRVAECSAMCCGEKVTLRSDHFEIFWKPVLPPAPEVAEAAQPRGGPAR